MYKMSFSRIPAFVKVLAGAAGVVSATGLVYVVRPSVFLSLGTSWKRHQVGLRRKSIVLEDGFVFSYAEKGQYKQGIPSILMVHGLTGSLDAAVPIVKTMPKDVHVISIDAPGHGKSSAVTENDYRMMGMAKRLKQFTAKTGIDKKKFHLVGWAMGGTIAACYAGEYPEDLNLVTIACPAIKCPTVSEPMKEVVSGKERVLLPRNPQELQDLMDILLVRKIQFPAKVLDFVFNSRMKKRDDHKKVLKFMMEDCMNDDDNVCIKQIAKITTPSQIIWGEKDGLIDISGADVVADTLENHCKRKDVIPNCGHSFYMEEPHSFGGLLTAFQMDFRLNQEKWQNEQFKKGTPLGEKKQESKGDKITPPGPAMITQKPTLPTGPVGQCLVCQFVPVMAQTEDKNQEQLLRQMILSLSQATQVTQSTQPVDEQSAQPVSPEEKCDDCVDTTSGQTSSVSVNEQVTLPATGA